jgi:hypothetical protein
MIIQTSLEEEEEETLVLLLLVRQLRQENTEIDKLHLEITEMILIQEDITEDQLITQVPRTL